MKRPKFNIGDTVESPMACGWIESIYKEIDRKKPRFVYGIKDAEDDFVYLEEEERIKGV